MPVAAAKVRRPGGLCTRPTYFLRAPGRAKLGFSRFFVAMTIAALLAGAPVAGWLAAYRARELLLGRGLSVLGVWALLNLVGSGYQLPRTDRRAAAHHFHFMNCCWAFLNAVLAAVGILRTHPGAPPAGFTAAAAAHDHRQLVLIFAANAVLDVGYLALGWWLVARAARPALRPITPVRLLGYGRSLWVQGGFLLVFDAVMALVFQS